MADTDRPVVLFLGGDVTTGRGVDQALPSPSPPLLHEPVRRERGGGTQVTRLREPSSHRSA